MIHNQVPSEPHFTLENSFRRNKMGKYFALLAALSLSLAGCEATSDCAQKLASSYLDTAVHMIERAKYTLSEHNLTRGALDCSELLQMGYNKSGLYKIYPLNRITEGQSLEVYCDMETDGGGWTLIQRRGNFQNPTDYFYRDWQTYKEGFGDLKKDFWLGNDYIYALTNQKVYSVRFDLRDIDNNERYAHYDTFWIDHEFDKYKLHINDYSGNAGDSMTQRHNKRKFSTKDQDNDNNGNCANLHKGGWWYNKLLDCYWANLNGLYLNEKNITGVNWHTWKTESIQSTEIKIRPKNFKY